MIQVKVYDPETPGSSYYSFNATGVVGTLDGSTLIEFDRKSGFLCTLDLHVVDSTAERLWVRGRCVENESTGLVGLSDCQDLHRNPMDISDYLVEEKSEDFYLSVLNVDTGKFRSVFSPPITIRLLSLRLLIDLQILAHHHA